MMPFIKFNLSIAAVIPILAGCATTNPKAAFDEMSETVVSRNGHQVRWMRGEPDHDEIERTIAPLLQTNLTAHSAVAIALLNNRSLQAEFEEIGVSQAELAQVSRLRNPEFNGLWRWPAHGPKVVNAEYSLAQDFLDLLTLPARKKMAARNLEAMKHRIAHHVLTLGEETQAAFYTVQAGQHLTNRLAIIVEINEAAADLANRQHEAGNINNLELQNQQATYAQSRLDFARAQAQLRADRERLNRLLGLWGKQTTWQVQSQLPPLPERELPVENVEALAVSRRLDLAAARSEVINLQSALKLKKSIRWLPGASVGFNAEHDLDHSWVLGPSLRLEVPVFDQGQPELARLTAEYRRAARKFEALAINIRSEVRERRDALIAARDAAEYYEKVLLPQRQRVLRETLLQYNAMQVSNYVLFAAKEREARAEREAIEALRDYWIARARLESAVGGNLTGEAPPKPKTIPDSKEHKH